MFPVVLDKIVLRRRNKTLLGPISLSLAGQGVTMIVGPNGAGKTSLLRAMHGIERLSSGSLRWAVSDGEARKQQAFVFQTPIMMRRSVYDNLAYPLALQNCAKGPLDAAVRRWAARIDVAAMLGRPARVLSGGERQKLALARALIRDPRMLFLDEPCAALDGRATRDIEALILEVAAQGTRIIMSTHNLAQARRLGDDVILLVKGCIEEYASVSAFFDHPKSALTQAFIRGDIIE